MENIDNLIEDLIEERKCDRLRAYVYRRLKKDGYTINKPQLEYLNYVIDNDRLIVIKGRQLGISTINNYLADFYNMESCVYANIQHIHRSKAKLSEANVVILDDLLANFNMYDDVINEKGYHPLKIIITSTADHEGSYLYKLYESDRYNSVKIPNTERQVNSMDMVFMADETINREFYCNFI